MTALLSARVPADVGPAVMAVLDDTCGTPIQPICQQSEAGDSAGS
ncbi:MAG TPA: hypothetical protein VJ978_04090 [Nitriliruptoraceae bacterium]|nr:hypothetical protein [Nitriliruptoraceae bacterium]